MRHPDWTSRLWAMVREHEAEPFECGQHDCCLLVARCLDAMTGSEFALHLSGCYHDHRSAARFITKSGGMREAVSGFLGPVSDLTRPRRGDVALVPTEGGDGVGICVGPTIAVAAEGGVTHYPLSAALAVWRVD